MVPDATVSTATMFSVTMDLDMFLTINNPLGSDSPIIPSFAEMDVSLMDETTEMAKLNLAWFPVAARSPGSDTFIIQNSGSNVVLTGDGSDFAAFLTKFLHAGPLRLGVSPVKAWQEREKERERGREGERERERERLAS